MSNNSNHTYKATFILDTRKYTESVDSLIDKLKGVVEAVHGVVKDVKNHGTKDFLRAVDRKFPAGIYLELDFEGPATAPAALNEKLKLDRTVNRIFIESVA